MMLRTPCYALGLAAPLLFAMACATPDGGLRGEPVDAGDARVSGSMEGEPGWREASGSDEHAAAEPEASVLAPRPFPDAFLPRSVLLGNTVRIEGPDGVLDHVASRSDPTQHERSVEYIDGGLLQRIVGISAESAGIRAQLDGMQIMAMQELQIYVRSDLTEVRIEAQGDAFWKSPGSGEERRGDRVDFAEPVPGPTDAPVNASVEKR